MILRILGEMMDKIQAADRFRNAFPRTTDFAVGCDIRRIHKVSSFHETRPYSPHCIQSLVVIIVRTDYQTIAVQKIFWDAQKQHIIGNLGECVYFIIVVINIDRLDK